MIQPLYQDSLNRLCKRGLTTQEQADSVQHAPQLAQLCEFDSAGPALDRDLLAWLLLQQIVTPDDLEAALETLRQSVSLDDLDEAVELVLDAQDKAELGRTGITREAVIELHRDGVIDDFTLRYRAVGLSWRVKTSPDPAQSRLATLIWLVEKDYEDEILPRVRGKPGYAPWLPQLQAAKRRRDEPEDDGGAEWLEDCRRVMTRMRYLNLITPAQIEVALGRLKVEPDDDFDFEEGLFWLLCRGIVTQQTVEDVLGEAPYAGGAPTGVLDYEDFTASSYVRRVLGWYALAKQGITREAVDQLAAAIRLPRDPAGDLRISVGRKTSGPVSLPNTAKWMAGAGVMTPDQIDAMWAHVRGGTKPTGGADGAGRATAAGAASPAQDDLGALPGERTMGRLVMLALIVAAAVMYWLWRRQT